MSPSCGCRNDLFMEKHKETASLGIILFLDVTVIYSVIGDCPSYNISRHRRYVCVELDSCMYTWHVIKEMLSRHVESRQGFDTKVSLIYMYTCMT